MARLHQKPLKFNGFWEQRSSLAHQRSMYVLLTTQKATTDHPGAKENSGLLAVTFLAEYLGFYLLCMGIALEFDKINILDPWE